MTTIISTNSFRRGTGKTSVVVNLATGVATGTAGVSRIDNATGGSAADILACHAFVNRLLNLVAIP